MEDLVLGYLGGASQKDGSGWVASAHSYNDF
jgi:hypothetical protein